MGHGKQHFSLALADGSPLSFASLCKRWSKDGEFLESFAVITRATAPALAVIHLWQPVIIDPARFDDWLDPTSPMPRTWTRSWTRNAAGAS
ncbi:MAG: SOS response-associated peptidase family protein [Pseudomonadales bacterium]|nr:SOS response-associated peptidase family protein [Pseudomonadales bacterium]